MKKLGEVLQNREENYILPFFWQHGEDEKTLCEYMRIIHESSIGAVCVESRPHPDFAGEKWWNDMDIILREAEKLGMKVWILDDSHFPTGYANGAAERAPKSLKHQYMCYRTLEMAGPMQQVEFELERYMKPAPLPPWVPQQPAGDDDFSDDRLVTILACPVLEKEELGEPIELVGKIEEGRVVFDLPDGYFKIFVIYITRNGKGRNNYINFMDKESCRILIDAVYEPHYAHYAKYFGNVIAGFFSDEPPIGNVDGYQPVGPIGTIGQDLPWSAAAEERMTEEYGSSEWTRHLPYLWEDAEEKEEQAKIRNAYMNMVTKLVAECFSGQLGTWCEEHGVEYIGHMLEDCDMHMNLGASMGHFFRGLSGQHMAGIDNIGGQVMINGQDARRHDQPACRDEAGFYQYMIGKMGASHAAFDPKKKGRTMCENFGAYGWQSGPKEEKFMMDHFMVRGVNRFVPHAFSPAPFPDPDCPPHFYAHGENPTYRAFGKLMAYTNRVCHLIDGGTPFPDVAVLYAAEGVWAGEGTSDIPICRKLTQAQIDYHILPADVLTGEICKISLEKKRFTANGVEYRALVIPGCEFLDSVTASFLAEAQKNDFPIVFVKKKPVGIVGAGKEENEKFRKMAEQYPVMEVEELSAYLKEKEHLPLQVMMVPENKRMTTYHYQLEGYDEIFLLNEMAKETYTGRITAAAQGIPVRYIPWENHLERVKYEQKDQKTVEVKLSIDPLELCVLVFLKDTAEAEALLREYGTGERRENREKVCCVEAFDVYRVDAKAYLAGEKEKKYETDHVCAPFVGMQKQYPDYSGYYIYETELPLETGGTYQLQIDQVSETVEVFFNGKSLGMKVQAPYRFEIPVQAVREKNQLRMEVATLLERKIHAMGAEGFSLAADRPYSPTGIVGEVAVYR